MDCLKFTNPAFVLTIGFVQFFAAYNAPTFKIAKNFVPILSPLTVNSHTVSNSYFFANDFAGISDASSY